MVLSKYVLLVTICFDYARVSYGALWYRPFMTILLSAWFVFDHLRHLKQRYNHNEWGVPPRPCWFNEPAVFDKTTKFAHFAMLSDFYSMLYEAGRYGDVTVMHFPYLTLSFMGVMCVTEIVFRALRLNGYNIR